MAAPTFSETEIRALGSEQRIKRHFEDATEAEVLEHIAQEVQALAERWSSLDDDFRETTRQEWPSTEDFAQRIANRPARALSPLIRDYFTDTRSRWVAARNAMKNVLDAD